MRGVAIALACALSACSLLIPFGDYNKGSHDGGAADDAAEEEACTPVPDFYSDNENCGACGHSCLGTPCDAALCQPQKLAASSDNSFSPDEVALDDTHVYVSGRSVVNGSIVRLPKDTSAHEPATDVALGVGIPAKLVVAGDYVYWTQGYGMEDAGPDALGVGRAPKTGVVGRLYVAGQADPFALRVDDASVYWTNVPNGDIWKANATPPAAAQRILASTSAIDLAVDEEWLYFTVENNEGRVVRVAKDGTNPLTLADHQFQARAIALDDTYVYWTSVASSAPTTGVIRRVPKAGGDVTDLETGQSLPACLAVDPDSIYWTTQTSLDSPMNGQILKAPKTGGPPLVLATGLRFFNNIAVDEQHVYWTDDGVVYRVPK